MFTLRRRPKGLEVPACEACNQATRQHEQVAALLGRVYPDGPTETEQEEMERVMRSVSSNNPGLLEEIRPSLMQSERFVQSRKRLPSSAVGLINCSGPLLNQSIQAFGAKLGFALHYATTRRVIPPSGGVAVRWYSNYDAVTGGIPANLLKVLGPRRTLRQGEWSVGDQFSYAYAIVESAQMAIYFSAFRQSFAVLSCVSEESSRFKIVADIEIIHRPMKGLSLGK